MIRAAVVFSLVGSSLAAQTLWRPDKNFGFCRITGATNSTPIVLTVSNVAACGISANDQIVTVDNVGGNRAANSNPGSAPGVTKHLARRVGSFSAGPGPAASFALLDLDGAPVAGSGAYVANTGWVRRVLSGTVKAAPHIYLDGGGPLTSSLAGKAVPGNAFWQSVLAVSSFEQSRTAGWGRAMHPAEGYRGLVSVALDCYVTNAAPACAALLYDLERYDQLAAGAAFIQHPAGGQPNSTSGDYFVQVAISFAMAASLADAKGILTPTLKAAISEFFWGGLGYEAGGSDYLGRAKPFNTWKIGYNLGPPVSPNYSQGSVTYDGRLGSRSVTFDRPVSSITPAIVAGDLLFLPHPALDAYSQPGRVVSCSGNTCEIEAAQNRNIVNQPFAVSNPWEPTEAGWFFLQCASAYSVLCNVGSHDYAAGGHSAPGNPGGFGVYWDAWDNNLPLGRYNGIYAAGVLTCGWGDQRGCHAAGRASLHLHDQILRRYMQWQAGGMGVMTNGYNAWRGTAALWEWALIEKNGLTPSIDYVPQKMIDDATDQGAAAWLQHWGWVAWTEHTRYKTGADTGNSGAFLPYGLTNSLLGPAPPRRAAYYGWLKNIHGINGGPNVRASDIYSDKSFIAYDPEAATLTPATSYVFSTTASADCISRFGAADCATADWGNWMASSRLSWASNRLGYLAGYTPSCRDHCGAGVPQLNLIQGFNDPAGGRLLMGGGLAAEENTEPLHRSAPMVGSFANTRTYPAANQEGPPTVMVGRGNDSFLAVRLRYESWYKAAAGVTLAAKDWIHFKAGGRDFSVLREAVSASAPQLMRGQYLLPLAGCPTCAAADLPQRKFSNLHPTASAGLLAQVVAFTGNYLLTSESGSGSNLAYTGGAAAAKVQVCASANASTCDASNSAMEWALVVEQTAGGAGSLAPTVSFLSSGLRVIEIQHATVPAVAVMGAPDGPLISAGAFSTTHGANAQYVLTHLAPGSMTITRNGLPLPGSPFAVGSDGVVSFDSSSGAFSLNGAAPPSLSVTTVSLGAANQSETYSATLAASGGVSPYSWSLAAGSLPPGVALSAGGVLSGVPTTAGTFNFTVRVTDGSAATAVRPLALVVGISTGSFTPGQRLRGRELRGGRLR